MKKTDFYKLTRTVQDNLLESFRGEFEPKPLAFAPGVRPTAVAWFSLTGLALALVVGLCVVGYGNMDNPLSLHPTPVVAAFVLLSAAMAFGVVRALAARAAVADLPFKPGVYVFPANVIDARDQYLSVFPLSELKAVKASGGSVVAQFGVRRFSFRVDAARAPELAQRIQQARDHLFENIDDAERRRIDPLEPPLVGNPLASTIPIAVKPPGWAKLRWVVIGVFGVVFGVGLFYARNKRSDTAMYTQAKTADDISTYKRYLGRGKAYQQIVRQELLPRAELKIAIAEGTVEAIDAFQEAYPDTAITKEVTRARQVALVAAFEDAQKKGNLAELIAFSETYPRHDLDKYLSEAKHAIYVRALNRYRREVPGASPEVAKIVEALIEYAEQTGPKKTADGVVGPTVLVQVRREPSRDMKRANDLVQKNPMYKGVTSRPSRYLDDDSLKPHEGQVAKGIADALSAAFDPEVLTFAVGDRLAEEAKVAGPAVVIQYRIEPSGAAYASKKPLGIFIGLLFIFRNEFVMPGGKSAMKVAYNLSQTIPIDMLQNGPLAPPPGTLETKIYTEMLGRAFSEAQKRYLADWVK